MKPSMYVISPGLFTTVQDGGRFGYRSYGVPVSGAMDRSSMAMANALLDNDTNDAVLECTILGPKLQFNVDTFIAIVGADFSLALNDKAVAMHKAISINAGDVLTIGQAQSGMRCYLAVKGGVQTPRVLDSRSFYIPITDVARLTRGEELPILMSSIASDRVAAFSKVSSRAVRDDLLSVTAGPEFENLPKKIQQKLIQNTFTVGKNNDRMAYQLDETIENQLPPMLTSAVLPGTVQLTPSGKLIVLMRDCQTTGGYPRVLQLTEESINLLSQKKQGDQLRFVIR